MVTLNDLVFLLYTAHTRFDSLAATLNYGYRPRTLRQAIDEWRQSRYGFQGTAYLSAECRRPPADRRRRPHRPTAGETLLNLASSDSLVELQWSFWLEKPDMFRHDISGGKHSSTLVINRTEESVVYGEGRRRQTTTVEPLTAPRRAEDFLFIDPSPLLATHELTQLSECAFLNREALCFRAIPRYRERVATDDFFYVGDHYDVVVDLERGILLKYTAAKGDIVFAEARVETIAFDQPIDEAVFWITREQP